MVPVSADPNPWAALVGAGVLLVLLLPLTVWGAWTGYALAALPPLFFLFVSLTVVAYARIQRSYNVDLTPESSIQSAPMGAVELQGTVQSLSGRTTTPITGQECVYYRATLTIRQGSPGTSPGAPPTYREDYTDEPFVLEGDDGGRALIDPGLFEEAAFLLGEDVHARSKAGDFPQDRRQPIEDFVQQFDDSFDLQEIPSRRVTFSETYLTSDQQLYVLGKAVSPERDDMDVRLDEPDDFRVHVSDTPDDIEPGDELSKALRYSITEFVLMPLPVYALLVFGLLGPARLSEFFSFIAMALAYAICILPVLYMVSMFRY